MTGTSSKIGFTALIATVLVVLGLVATTAGGSRTFDRPQIVFGKSIGDIRLGMTRDRVEYRYGDTNQGSLQVLDDYFPVGTKYHGKPLFRMTYRIHGGKVEVDYVGDRVKVIATTSPYYRTTSRLRVGSRIPLGPCHKDKYGSCQYYWKGFAYEPDCGKAWLGGTRNVSTNLYVKRGRIVWIEIGDPDVILYCF